uniref:Uncharacterized protein n=1 Tax=Oryza punctata TaxID=4537 RepID=A0A0E0JVH2_ORYPU
MTITCNIDSSEFYPKFNFHGKIRQITYEGQKKLYPTRQCPGTVNRHFSRLKHPTVDRYEGYMLRNHPSLFQIEAHAPFYLACFDHLLRLPKQPIDLLLSKLPYAVGDNDGHWTVIAYQHLLLSEQLSHGYGISNWFQSKYRRNGYCHRTHPGSVYSIVQTHRIYHQYFPRTLPALMRGMMLMRQLDDIGP